MLEGRLHKTRGRKAVQKEKRNSLGKGKREGKDRNKGEDKSKVEIIEAKH